ncbi:hypothetical protein TNCT_556121 [Trichonephila clavata]|uniref:Uncharacterized protein n=1 Tax=Trichonephila clavata TaxID=2740835 RepID=A0A8X6FZV6_TRICU|nr:hypothetical protein TNCT_556121 [Trichonephila clavata]
MLTQDEASELFFKLGRRTHVRSMIWLQAIVEGRVKLSTNHDLSFYFANPTFSCKIPPIFVVDDENGSIIFPDFVERFKQDTTEKVGLKSSHVLLYFDPDGKPDRIEYYENDKAKNKLNFVKCYKNN